MVGTGSGVTAGILVKNAEALEVLERVDTIVRARRLSRGTMRNIRQNLFCALLYNTLGIPIAAGVL
jgi:Cu+-exporting ATPase